MRQLITPPNVAKEKIDTGKLVNTSSFTPEELFIKKQACFTNRKNAF